MRVYYDHVNNKRYAEAIPGLETWSAFAAPHKSLVHAHAAVLSALAQCYSAQCAFPLALRRAEQAKSLLRGVMPRTVESIQELARSEHTLGGIHARMGSRAAAIATLESALAMMAPADGDIKEECITSLALLGELYMLVGQPEKGLECVERAEAQYDGIPVKHARNLLDLVPLVAASKTAILTGLDRPAEAIDCALASYGEVKAFFGANSIELARGLISLGVASWAEGDPPKDFLCTMDMFLRAAEIFEELHMEDSPEYAQLLEYMGTDNMMGYDMLVKYLGTDTLMGEAAISRRAETARSYFERSLALRLRLLPTTHPDIAAVERRLRDVNTRAGLATVPAGRRLRMRRLRQQYRQRRQSCLWGRQQLQQQQQQLRQSKRRR